MRRNRTSRWTLNNIPKVALGPIFIVWLGDQVNLMAVAISVIDGVDDVLRVPWTANKITLLKTFGATKAQILVKAAAGPMRLP